MVSLKTYLKQTKVDIHTYMIDLIKLLVWVLLDGNLGLVDGNNCRFVVTSFIDHLYTR